MASTRLVKACSYQTLSRYSGERARNVDEFRFKQRASINNHRIKGKLSHILEKRHTLDIDEMCVLGRDEYYDQQNCPHQYSSSLLPEALAELYKTTCYYSQHSELVSTLLEQNWSLIIQGLSDTNIRTNMDTVSLLGSIRSYQPSCLKLLIQHGLLYKIRDLFRQDETRTASIALLNDLISKTPSLISYILTIMLTDNTCALFEDIFLMCGWSDIEQLILFYSLIMSVLTNTSVKQQFVENVDPVNLLKGLLTPTIIKHIASYCIQPSMKSNLNLIKTGLWILTTTASLAKSTTDSHWSAEIKTACNDTNIEKKIKKLISSAKRSARKNDSNSLDISYVSELAQLCNDYLEEILNQLGTIKC